MDVLGPAYLPAQLEVDLTLWDGTAGRKSSFTKIATSTFPSVSTATPWDDRSVKGSAPNARSFSTCNNELAAEVTTILPMSRR
jgi:hypothetical protein